MHRIGTAVACLLAFTAARSLVAQQPQPEEPAPREPQPIDFSEVDRSIGKLPELAAEQPLYGLFLFGLHADTRVWAVLDKSQPDLAVYDRLYLDLDADGDLTEAGERLSAERSGESKATFELAAWPDPATGAVHEEVRITWKPERTSFTMLWRGEAVTRGAYGPDGDSYGQFGDAPATAPILVPGWDRPFEFERWYSGELTLGGTTDFKVFIGNRGSATGQFSCVDDEFLPPDEYPVATLIYSDSQGKQRKVHAKLTERC